jgi:hypothetical protein
MQETPMQISVDVWLRGDVHATTHALPEIPRGPGEWTDEDVAEVLVGMLRLMNTSRNPTADPNGPVALRGFSWIVNPFETGGVVIAIEMSMGAAVAGPFDVSESALSGRIQRVMDADRRERSGGRGPGPTVH